MTPPVSGAPEPPPSQIESSVLLLGKECAVWITGDPEEADLITTPAKALAAIREAIRLGQERNDEANVLRVERDEALNKFTCTCGADSDIHADNCPAYAPGGPYAPKNAPAECELKAIAALLVSAVAHTADWRERAQWLFDRGVRIQEVGAALPAPEPPRLDVSGISDEEWGMLAEMKPTALRAALRMLAKAQANGDA